MKTVMVLIHNDPGQEARLQCALDVVRALDGHLVCLDVVGLPVIADGFGVGTATATLIVDERDQEDKNINALEPRLVNEGVSHEWERIQTNSDIAVTEAARLIDLLVVGRRGIGEAADSGGTAARLAELSSAPVLLVPTDQKSLDLGGRALVTWDGSAPSDNAIRAAVPLLKLASEVDVLTVGETENDADPNEVADYLARHGCRVTARRIARSGDLAEQLLSEMHSSRANWCVMGSYGHKRLREFLFGGPTRTLFAKATIPLLVSH